MVGDSGGWPMTNFAEGYVGSWRLYHGATMLHYHHFDLDVTGDGEVIMIRERPPPIVYSNISYNHWVNSPY